LAEHPNATPNEYGNNMNCLIYGDSLCDMPADIKDEHSSYRYYKTYHVGNCTYCEQLLDSFLYQPNGWYYKPDLKNGQDTITIHKYFVSIIFI